MLNQNLHMPPDAKIWLTGKDSDAGKDKAKGEGGDQDEMER